MKYIAIPFILIGIAITFVQCSKEHTIPNEEELITTLKYTLISPEGDTIVLSFYDPDGDGGAQPEIEGDTLKAHTAYSGTLTLLDETVSPPDNVTEEIEDEAADHLFFFSFDPNSIDHIDRNDVDDFGYPVGLSTTLVTNNQGIGTLNIILRHKPDKTQPVLSPETVGGETDIEVNLPYVIQ